MHFDFSSMRPVVMYIIPYCAAIPGDGRCLFRSVVHGACLRSGKPAPSESNQRELADELRARVCFPCPFICLGIYCFFLISNSLFVIYGKDSFLLSLSKA